MGVPGGSGLNHDLAGQNLAAITVFLVEQVADFLLSVVVLGPGHVVEQGGCGLGELH